MKNLFKAAYVLCILASAIYCFKRPLYNWDLLPYSVLVLKMDSYDDKKAFNYTYDAAKKKLPQGAYHLLTDSTNAYRYELSNDDAAFREQLPFYVVKPLYTSLSYLAYKSGFSLPQATLIPSFISYLLIGLLFFYWLSLYLAWRASFFVSLLIMVSSPLIEIAKLSTPDCLSALLLLGSFYFIIERPSLRSALVCMCLSVFARMDNIVMCSLLISAIYLSRSWSKRLSLANFLSIIALFVFCYIMVGLIAMRFGWSIFFYNDFAHHLHPVYGSKADFVFGDYFRLMYEHIMSAINHSYFTIFMALHALNFFLAKKQSFDRLLVILIPLILLVRFILYPDISDRFYVAYYLVIVVLLVRNLSPLLKLSYAPSRRDP